MIHTKSRIYLRLFQVFCIVWYAQVGSRFAKLKLDEEVLAHTLLISLCNTKKAQRKNELIIVNLGALNTNMQLVFFSRTSGFLSILHFNMKT